MDAALASSSQSLQNHEGRVSMEASEFSSHWRPQVPKSPTADLCIRCHYWKSLCKYDWRRHAGKYLPCIRVRLVDIAKPAWSLWWHPQWLSEQEMALFVEAAPAKKEGKHISIKRTGVLHTRPPHAIISIWRCIGPRTLHASSLQVASRRQPSASNLRYYCWARRPDLMESAGRVHR